MKDCCYQFLKDTIWKQFTTRGYLPSFTSCCYQFLKDTIWKQFTTDYVPATTPEKLLSVPQRYNLKAIHNQNRQPSKRNFAVISSSKIQFESNSQQKFSSRNILQCCYQFLKDTIWKQFTTHSLHDWCSRVLLSVPQRYNLKAIHNLSKMGKHLLKAVISSSKIQFESNSQPLNQPKSLFWAVISSSKIQFESNSQLL